MTPAVGTPRAPDISVRYGDAWDLAETLEPASIDCIVTSPPYWGLRDYGTATWKGGDPDCAHKNGMLAPMKSTLNGGRFYGEHLKVHTNGMPYRSVCGRCGAVRVDRQFGLEPTPQEYVAKLVDLFARLRPALKDEGTVWLNLGDSYASGEIGRHDGRVDGSGYGARHPGPRQQQKLHSGLKPKDLVGIPWRVAFALQEDGWWLRSDIIWAKPNPMPESVTDRPTKSHEYIFLLSKSQRYFFDQDAVREEAIAAEHHARYADAAKEYAKKQPGQRDTGMLGVHPAGRNIRTVWSLSTRPYSGAHFAVFPPEIPERCIKAGTSERGVCPECGKAWERVVEREDRPQGRSEGDIYTAHAYANPQAVVWGAKKNLGGDGRAIRQEYWQAACSCNTEPIPATVLDPFAGSGTTLEVARKLGRNSIGFELNEEYRALIDDRLKQGVLC